jgi:ferrochelatase
MSDASEGVKQKSIGVLLVNLGTPDKPDATSIRRFLREFLSDHRVVEIPRFIWLLILHLFILPFRPQKLVKAYQSIWTEEGAPLLAIAYQQQSKIEDYFATPIEDQDQPKIRSKYLFATAMNYGNPSIKSALNKFKDQNIDKLLVLPLYPQYSGSTSAAIFDQVTNLLQSWRNIPELRFIKEYYNHPLYIKALANSVTKHSKNNNHLVVSFHGIPIDYCTKGDPYNKQCHESANLLAKELNLSDKQWTISFQSLFGKAEWLKPYTSDTLKAMPAEGIKDIDIICPGFSNDCLETLEEIEVENKQFFIEAGGNSYHYIPALNDSDDHIALLVELINNHTQGW